MSQYTDSNAFLDQFKEAEGQQQQDPNQQQAAYGQYDYSQYYQQYYGGYGGQYDYSQYQQQPQQQASGTGAESGSNQSGYDYYGGGYGGGNSNYYSGMQSGFPGMYSSAPMPPRSVGGGEPSRSLWLGNLASDTTEAELHATFGPFGLIESIKVVPGKNCAFVKFVELDAAIQAFNQMQRCVIHGQLIRVGWGKQTEPGGSSRPGEESMAPPSRNLWVGGIPADTTEEQIRAVFGRYGLIDKVRILGPKNCCFVNFTTLDAATNAKRELSGTLFGDRTLKINYGREGGPPPKYNYPVVPTSPGGSLIEETIDAPEPPPDAIPPVDPVVKQLIDTTAGYVEKNGLVFEMNLKEKQKDNPKLGFLYEGHPHHGYYKLKLWCLANPSFDANVIRAKYQAREQAQQQMQQKNYGAVPPPMASDVYRVSAREEQHRFPKDDAVITKLTTLVDSLDGSKDSIKDAKNWILDNRGELVDMAAYLKQRVERASNFDLKLNILYVIHEALNYAAKNRDKGEFSDPVCNAFYPVLPIILKNCLQTTDTKDQEMVKKVVRLWEEKKVFDTVTIKKLEEEMRYVRGREERRDDRRGNERGGERRDYQNYQREERGGERDDNRKRRDRPDDRYGESKKRW